MRLRTINRKRITRAMRQSEPLDVERPRTRADCMDGPRPCPWVGCRHHLYLEVKPNGSIVLNRPGLEPWELEHSCSLDVAPLRPDGELIAALLGVSRRRLYQLLPAARERARLPLAALHGLPCPDEEAQAPI